MILLADTHAFFWWITKSSRLSNTAARAINRALKTGPIHLSSMSIFELGVLSRKRISLNVPFSQWIARATQVPEVAVVPVSAEIAEVAAGISASAHGDPVDRIIVATALSLGATIVTADQQMHDGDVPTIW